MKESTLLLLTRAYGSRRQVLLGWQQHGPFMGLLMGPGGKCERGELPIHCVIRETREEVGVELLRQHLNRVGQFVGHTRSRPKFLVHVYLAERFLGCAQESSALKSDWYDISNIPYQHMISSDKFWLPLALRKRRFSAKIFFGRNWHSFKRIELARQAAAR